MNTRRLDHVGVAVRDAARARAFYEGVLGLEALSEEIVAPMRLKIVKLRAGDATIELIEPLEGEEVVRRFLQKRGEGIHHLCFEVEDVGRAAEEVRERGCRVLWPEARPGSGGRPVQFLHPADAFGTLVELVEAARERFA